MLLGLGVSCAGLLRFRVRLGVSIVLSSTSSILLLRFRPRRAVSTVPSSALGGLLLGFRPRLLLPLAS